MVAGRSRRAGLALVGAAGVAVACAATEAPRPRPASPVEEGAVPTATTADGTTRTASAAPGAPQPGAPRGSRACERVPPVPVSEGGGPSEGARDLGLAEASMRAGLAAAERGEYASALVAFERARTADPYAGLAYLEAAEAHLYTDDDRPTIRGLLANALRLLPENPRVHARYADVLADFGETARAEAHWRCALELRPGLVEARKRLGVLLQESGRLGEAEAELRRSVHDAGDDLQARLLFAEVLEAAQKSTEAAKELEAAARLAKRGAPLYRRAAALYEVAGNVAAAKRCTSAADKLEPPAKDRNLRPLPKARDGER